jgi:hypothetical protein
MVNLEQYFQRAQTVIGSTKSADEIVEDRWQEVVKVLSDTAIDCAQELQREEGKAYFKPEREGKPAYILGYDKAPPTRLLALNLILSYWIGWISQTHGLSDAMNMIFKAYSTGKMDFDDYKKAEDEKKAAAKEGKH